VVTGVSGSGKSTLVEDILYPALRDMFTVRWSTHWPTIRSRGLILSIKIIEIDQSAIGRTATLKSGDVHGLV